MTKEMFIKCIETIKNNQVKENKFIDALNEISSERVSTFIYSDYENLVISLLAEELNVDAEILYWWIYDTDFGSDEKYRTLLIDDTEVELDTAEKFYDYLTK